MTDGISQPTNTRPQNPPTPLNHSGLAHKLPERIEWDAYEHEHREHNEEWFWIMWIVAVTVAIAAIIFGNFLFAAISVVSGFMISMYASEAPRLIHFTVSHKGVAIGRTLYPFSSLESFAIREDQEEHDGQFLLLKSRRMFAPLIIIPVADDVNTKILREYMLEELREKEHHLPFAERLMELVGF